MGDPEADDEDRTTHQRADDIVTPLPFRYGSAAAGPSLPRAVLGSLYARLRRRKRAELEPEDE